VQKPEVDKTQSLGAGLDVIGETVTKFAGRGDAKSSRAIIGGRSKSTPVVCRIHETDNDKIGMSRSDRFRTLQPLST